MDSTYKRNIESKKLQYIKKLYAEDDVILEGVERSISENNLRPINISSVEGKILRIILKIHNVQKMVEIGTLAGYSAINLARALPEGGILYTFEMEEKCARIAQENISNSDVAAKVKVITGNAHHNLKGIEGEAPFDAIFIDAEKQGYPDYLAWAEKNIRKGGLIIGDNTFLFGAVFDDEIAKNEPPKLVAAMKNFNNTLADKERYDSIILPTEEGLTIAIKKF